MSERICYMVIATLPNRATAEDYIRWLDDGHLDAVIRGGARSALVVRLDPGGANARGEVRVMTQYQFADRGDFDRYVRETAPALRSEGLARFGPQRGVRFERSVGQVVAERLHQQQG
jgi:hypothetical protein